MTAALRYNPILVFASEGDGCGDSEGWDGLYVGVGDTHHYLTRAYDEDTPLGVGHHHYNAAFVTASEGGGLKWIRRK